MPATIPASASGGEGIGRRVFFSVTANPVPRANQRAWHRSGLLPKMHQEASVIGRNAGPEEGFQLSQLIIAFPKRDAPCNQLAKSLVVGSLDSEFGPIAEMSVLDGGFLHGDGMEIVLQQAAHFGPYAELGPIHFFRLPLHGQTHAVAQLWVLAQVKLVGVPFVEAG